MLSGTHRSDAQKLAMRLLAGGDSPARRAVRTLILDNADQENMTVPKLLAMLAELQTLAAEARRELSETWGGKLVVRR